jgi:hypothetical protein
MSKTTLHPEIQLDDTAADWYDGHAQAASQVTVAPSSLENNDTKYDEPAPPPDGGIKAWLQVLASWSLFFNTWGIVNTYVKTDSLHLDSPVLILPKIRSLSNVLRIRRPFRGFFFFHSLDWLGSNNRYVRDLCTGRTHIRPRRL